MARKKVEICGVNTSSLPLLSDDFQEVMKMQMIFFKLAASVL